MIHSFPSSGNRINNKTEPMTPDQITAGNILLAKFDGMKKVKLPTLSFDLFGFDDGTKDTVNLFTESELKYHSSFDWIMRVARKFVNLELDNMDDDTYGVVSVYRYEINSIFMEYPETTLPIFEKLVEAVQWYNKIKL